MIIHTNNNFYYKYYTQYYNITSIYSWYQIQLFPNIKIVVEIISQQPPTDSNQIQTNSIINIVPTVHTVDPNVRIELASWGLNPTKNRKDFKNQPCIQNHPWISYACYGSKIKYQELIAIVGQYPITTNYNSLAHLTTSWSTGQK